MIPFTRDSRIDKLCLRYSTRGQEEGLSLGKYGLGRAQGKLLEWWKYYVALGIDYMVVYL